MQQQQTTNGGVEEKIFVRLFVSLVNDGGGFIIKKGKLIVFIRHFFPSPYTKTKSNNHLDDILSSTRNCY